MKGVGDEAARSAMKLSGPLRELQGFISKIPGWWKLAAAAVVAAVGVAIKTVSKMWEGGKAIAKTAKELNLTAEQATRLQRASKQLGIELTSLKSIADKIDAALERVTKHDYEAVAAFTELGISIKSFAKGDIVTRLAVLSGAMDKFDRETSKIRKRELRQALTGLFGNDILKQKENIMKLSRQIAFMGGTEMSTLGADYINNITSSIQELGDQWIDAAAKAIKFEDIMRRINEWTEKTVNKMKENNFEVVKMMPVTDKDGKPLIGPDGKIVMKPKAIGMTNETNEIGINDAAMILAEEIYGINNFSKEKRDFVFDTLKLDKSKSLNQLIKEKKFFYDTESVEWLQRKEIARMMADSKDFSEQLRKDKGGFWGKTGRWQLDTGFEKDIKKYRDQYHYKLISGDWKFYEEEYKKWVAQKPKFGQESNAEKYLAHLVDNIQKVVSLQLVKSGEWDFDKKSLRYAPGVTGGETNFEELYTSFIESNTADFEKMKQRGKIATKITTDYYDLMENIEEIHENTLRLIKEKFPAQYKNLSLTEKQELLEVLINNALAARKRLITDIIEQKEKEIKIVREEAELQRNLLRWQKSRTNEGKERDFWERWAAEARKKNIKTTGEELRDPDNGMTAEQIKNAEANDFYWWAAQNINSMMAVVNGWAPDVNGDIANWGEDWTKAVNKETGLLDEEFIKKLRAHWKQWDEDNAGLPKREEDIKSRKMVEQWLEANEYWRQYGKASDLNYHPTEMQEMREGFQKEAEELNNNLKAIKAWSEEGYAKLGEEIKTGDLVALIDAVERTKGFMRGNDVTDGFMAQAITEGNAAMEEAVQNSESGLSEDVKEMVKKQAEREALLAGMIKPEFDSRIYSNELAQRGGFASSVVSAENPNDYQMKMLEFQEAQNSILTRILDCTSDMDGYITGAKSRD